MGDAWVRGCSRVIDSSPRIRTSPCPVVSSLRKHHDSARTRAPLEAEHAREDPRSRRQAAPGGEVVGERPARPGHHIETALARIEDTQAFRGLPLEERTNLLLRIPITEDVAVRLQAYAEERDTQLFREATELHRVQRELRAAFLAERQAYLEPIERLVERTDAGASEYASIGIRFCYILNAGGLIAVPAIMEILPDAAIAASKMLVPAFTFVGGVFLAAATNYLAYHSMIKASEGHSYQGDAVGKEVLGMYFPPEDQAARDAEIAQDRFDRERNREKAAFWANTAKATFCLSISAFIVGVLSAIHGLS